MIIKDVTCEEVLIEDLINRLKYRQDKRRKTGIPVDELLNLVMCWRGHVQEGIRKLDTCIECGEKLRYRIEKGRLKHIV